MTLLNAWTMRWYHLRGLQCASGRSIKFSDSQSVSRTMLASSHAPIIVKMFHTIDSPNFSLECINSNNKQGLIEESKGSLFCSSWISSLGNGTCPGHLLGSLSHHPSTSSGGGVGIHISAHCDRERQQHRIYMTTLRSTTEFHFPPEDSRSYHAAHLEPVSPEPRSRISCYSLARQSLCEPPLFFLVSCVMSELPFSLHEDRRCLF